MPSVVAISVAPVKGLRLQHPAAVEVGPDGIPGDRRYFLVDARGDMVSATRLGPLVSVDPAYDEPTRTLSLTFHNGAEIAEAVELGDAEQVRFYGEPLDARPVLGDFSAALSDLVGQPVRLMASADRPVGVDRGPGGAVTVLSTASVARLGEQAAVDGSVDPRRFRMSFLLDGCEPHEEDAWVGRRLRVGDALIAVSGNVGRCALTTRDPETGVVDFKTLHHLQEYRGDVASTEPLPFGVYAEVVEPGRVAVGDPVNIAG